MRNSNFRVLLIIIATAALCLSAGSVSAINLSIYGVGHLSADSNDNGNDSQLYIASNSSRLGFSGDHGLDNGMKVLFQLESGVDISGRGTNDGNGGGTSNNLFSTARDSFVGLSGGFGTVMVGRMGVLNQWLYDFNLFADQVGDLGNIWGGTGLPGRANGMIAYSLPEIGKNLDILLAYIPENGTEEADSMLAKVNFKIGDVKTGAAYTSVGQGVGNSEHTAFAVTASYNWDKLNVGGGYQMESDMGGVSGNDRGSITIGASFAIVSNHTVKAQFTQSDADAADSDAYQIAIGYDYMLDKVTTVYAAYAGTNNDSNAAFMANNWGHGQAVTPAAGDDPSSLSVGIVYKFKAGLAK